MGKTHRSIQSWYHQFEHRFQLLAIELCHQLSFIGSSRRFYFPFHFISEPWVKLIPNSILFYQFFLQFWRIFYRQTLWWKFTNKQTEIELRTKLKVISTLDTYVYGFDYCIPLSVFMSISYQATEKEKKINKQHKENMNRNLLFFFASLFVLTSIMPYLKWFESQKAIDVSIYIYMYDSFIYTSWQSIKLIVGVFHVIIWLLKILQTRDNKHNETHLCGRF